MPWFKVDDGLHAHLKAVRAGVSAMGLWVLAGSWSADQLTDGWVPDYIVARLDPDYREHAATLVRAGLWDEDEHDGDKGWRFHEWAEHQPSREQVLADRKAAAERQRRARERAKARRDGEREPYGSNPDRHGVTHAQVTPVVTVPPTRPDPTRPVLPTEVPMGAEPPPPSASPTNRRGTRIPEDFTISPAMRVWAQKNAADVDVIVETANFVDHWTAKSGQDAAKVNWNAAWQVWMRKAQQWTGTRGAPGSRTSGANRHVDQRDDNPFRNGANATIASQHTGGHR